MRPIDKGHTPKDTNGKNKIFRVYQDARGDMIARLGEFCSYCEAHLDVDLAIEHVKHKDKYPQYELDWDNFLLSCRICNSTKGGTDTGGNEFQKYFWPDKDNTAIAIMYSEGGIVKANHVLNEQLKEKAERLIRLVGLDKTPLNDPQQKDRRWNNRREAWDLAARWKDTLSKNDTIDIREAVKDLAFAKGYFSIWMTVFQDDPDMRSRLIEAFPGTCKMCFDPNQNFAPIQRQGGQC